MTAKPNYFRLGLFVLTGVAILVIGIFILGAGELFTKGILVETYFDQSVEGLDVGALVKNRGVTIGKVTRIGFVSTKYPQETVAEEIRFGKYILVEMELDPDELPSKGRIDTALLQQRIDAGLRLRLSKGSITGPVLLEADYLDPESYPPLEIDWTPEAPYVPSAPSAMAQVISSIERVAKQLEEAHLDKVIGNIDTLIKTIDTAVKDLQIAQTREELVGLVEEVRRTNQRLGKIMDNAVPMAEYLRRMTRRLDNVVAVESEDLQAIIGNLRRTSANVEAVTEDAKENPSRLLFGNPPPRRKPGE